MVPKKELEDRINALESTLLVISVTTDLVRVSIERDTIGDPLIQRAVLAQLKACQQALDFVLPDRPKLPFP